MKKESTHFTGKLFLCFSMLVFLLICSLFRGSGKEPSVIGVKKCSVADNTIFALLILSGAVVTVISSVWVRREYIYKKSLGYKFV